jgi:adenosine deaminase
VRAADEPGLLDTLATRGVTLEVCPSSNVGLGVFSTPSEVPVRRIFEAGVPIALGADDPLLFGTRLTRQYELAREVYGFDDAELAELARSSIRGSAAPPDVQKRMLDEVDGWLRT